MYPRWRSTKGRGSIIYVFLHSTFGPIMFLLFLCMRLSELKFLMLSAMCLFLNGMTFGIACFTGILEMARAIIYPAGKKKEGAGNAPFSAIGRHGLSKAAYCAGRTIDDLVNDWRMET